MGQESSLRILYVVSYYKPADVYGGPVKSISALCEGLVRQGAQVRVLTTNANGNGRLTVPLGQGVEIEGVEVFYYPLAGSGPSSFFYSPALAHACREQTREADIAILDTFFTHAMGPAVGACRKANIPYIIPLRGQLLPWALQIRGRKKRLYLALAGRRYLNGAAALHCTDPSEEAALQQLDIRKRTIVVPNGIDSQYWQDLPQRGALRARLGIDSKDILLLFLGRLHRIKSPELALEAFGLLKMGQVHLVYAGPDEQGYQPGLQKRAEELGCGERVHFTGLLSAAEVRQALADADLLVMPSASESFGMAAVEAMAAGVPVVVSENVPVGRWIEEAGAGLVVRGQPGAYSKAIKYLIDSQLELVEMGERAKTLVAKRFEINLVAKMMINELKSSLVISRKKLI